jgi:hypothetical protein
MVYFLNFKNTSWFAQYITTQNTSYVECRGLEVHINRGPQAISSHGVYTVRDEIVRYTCTECEGFPSYKLIR